VGRELHPGEGQWISPDPAGLGAVDPGNPQTWNRYAYVMNNPLTLIDPTGLDSASCNDPHIRALCQAGNSSPYNGLPSIFGGAFSGWDFSQSLEYPIPVNTTTFIYNPPSLVTPPTLYDSEGNEIPDPNYTLFYTNGGWSSATTTVGSVFVVSGSANSSNNPANNGKPVPCEDQACELARAINKTGVQTLQNPCFVPGFYALSAAAATGVALAGVGSQTAVFPAFSETLAGAGPAISTGTSWLSRGRQLGNKVIAAVAGATAAAITYVCQ
jgi:hypothetical protein